LLPDLMGPAYSSLAKFIRYQIHNYRMISVRSLLTSVSVLTILCLTYSKITRKEEVADKAEKLDLVRKVIKEKCSGVEQEVYLSQGNEVVLQSPGFDSGEYVEGCEAKYEVVLDRDDQDLGQWRIKIVVEEMNLHCSSSYLLIKEDSEKTRRVKYCNEEDTGSKVFFSHEHLISIVFKNKGQCKEGGGCDGTRYQIRLSAEYV